MIELTAFQQLVLLDVAIRERHVGESPHGLAIKQDLTEMFHGVGELDGNETVNHGRLYPNLDEIVKRGFIEKSQRDKRTNEYSLTEAGSEAITNLEDLIRFAQGKIDVNPFVDDHAAVGGRTEQTMDAD